MFITDFGSWAAICSLRSLILKTEGQIIETENLTKTQIIILAYPVLDLSGFQQPGPVALLLGLTRSIYYLDIYAKTTKLTT